MLKIIGNNASRQQRSLVILFLIWTALQLILFFHYGVNTSVDSAMYQDNAAALLRGVFPQGRDIGYISYSIFLAAASLLGGDDVAVLFQVLFSGVALYFLYRAAYKITANEITSLLMCTFYLGWIKIHQWNFFIYTESLFTSMAIISFAALVLSRTKKHYALTLIIFLFTVLIRPTGIALLTGFLVYGLAYLYDQVSRTAWIITVFIVIASGLLILNVVMKDYGFIDSYRNAELIYPNISLGLQPPIDLIISSDEHAPLIRLIMFIYSNPIYFLKITLLKLLLFIGNVKPYFSVVHNAGIVAFLFPLYFFAAKGFQYFPLNRKEHYFITGFVIMQCAIVSLTSENWDGRFLIPVLPFVFMLSAVGINAWLRRQSQYKLFQ